LFGWRFFQAGAQALNERFLKREKEAIADQQRSQIILELEEKTRSLQESLVKMEKDHRIEMAKVKSDRKRISSLRKHEVSALLRERDFVWNQLKIMEEDYANRLRGRNQQLQLASENIENLRSTIEELQQANNEKNVELTIQTRTLLRLFSLVTLEDSSTLFRLGKEKKYSN
jgi:hypothetical protein